MGTERDRIISITLTEAEWRAFVAAQPQPVSWLRDRILEVVRPAAEEEARQAHQARQVA